MTTKPSVAAALLLSLSLGTGGCRKEAGPSAAVRAPKSAAPAPTVPPAPLPVPTGIFALTQAGAPIGQGVLDHSAVSGVVVRSAWPALEPKQGELDFAYLDAELAKVARAGKVASLVVTSGGVATPPWLLARSERVAFKDENEFHAAYGQTLEIPVFWDEGLLTHKKRLIAALGARFAKLPELKLVSAQCANATTDDWNLPGGLEAAAAWQKAGFSESKLGAACQEIVDATMAAFPNQIVRMAIGRVPPSLAATPDNVVRSLIAHTKATFPGRFLVQRHNLGAATPLATTGEKLYGWEVIRDEVPRSAAQFLWPASDTKTCRLDKGLSPCDPVNMFRRATEAALSYRLPYVEVYTADLVNPALAEEVRRLAAGLAAKGPPAAAPASAAPRASAAPAASPSSAPAVADEARALGNGTSSHVEFVGPTTKRTVAFSLYLPAGYEGNARRFPVLYWLHGKGGDERRSAHVARYLDRAIAAGQMPPTIMIIPNGGTDSFYTDSPDGSWPIETMVMDELLPYVDSHFRTLGTRAGRVIMGFSMGGFGALKFAAKYPDRFAAVVGYGAPRLDASLGMGGQDRDIFTKVFGGDRKTFEENTPSALFRANRDRVVKLGLKIRLVSGSEDGTRFSVQKLDQVLTELKVPHEHEELQGVRHMVALYYDAEAERGFAFLGRALANPAR